MSRINVIDIIFRSEKFLQIDYFTSIHISPHLAQIQIHLLTTKASTITLFFYEFCPPLGVPMRFIFDIFIKIQQLLLTRVLSSFITFLLIGSCHLQEDSFRRDAHDMHNLPKHLYRLHHHLAHRSAEIELILQHLRSDVG